MDHDTMQVLRLSASSRKKISAGEVINLMSIDTQKIEDGIYFSAAFPDTLVSIVITLSFMWKAIGPSSISAWIVLIVVLIINSCLTAKIQTLQVSEIKFILVIFHVIALERLANMLATPL